MAKKLKLEEDKVKDLLVTMSGGDIKEKHPELAAAVDRVLGLNKKVAASGSLVSQPRF